MVYLTLHADWGEICVRLKYPDASMPRFLRILANQIKGQKFLPWPIKLKYGSNQTFHKKHLVSMGEKERI